jgi:D-3-phosphoglycerate dehydrogenase
MPTHTHPVIAIIDDYENFVVTLKAYAKLKSRLPHADIRIITHQPLGDDGVRALADVEYLVLIRERTRVTAALLTKLPALKAIVQTGTVGQGITAHVDVSACAAQGVDIIEGMTSDGHSAAELTWALILSARRNLYPYMKSLEEGGWHQGAKVPEMARSLRGQTLGILGYGRIAQLLGGYAKAFGMTVIVWGRERTALAAKQDGVTMSASRDELFRVSDILTLQWRLNEETRHSVTLQDLSLMKPDALLVNTSRAALIAPNALQQALSLGRPGMAAMDVHDVEPSVGHHMLPNCVATPHIGYVERSSYEILFTAAFDKLIERLQPTVSDPNLPVRMS